MSPTQRASFDMANNVVKIKVDSSEYEARVKRASDAIADFGRKLGETGQTFVNATREQINFVNEIGKMPTVQSSAKGSLRELTQTITDLTVRYREMTDEERSSPFGQALNASLNQLTERAGQMKDAMVDVEASVRNAASDTRTFDQVAGAANLATSSLQTLQGAARVLGIEMGDDLQVIAKLQAAMAVTNGLTQIQTQLQRESAVMQGVMAIKAKAAAAAIELQGKATMGATAAQKAFNLVANANPYALLLTGITAVVGVLGIFSSNTDDATEAQNRFTAAVEDTKRELERMKAQSDFGMDIARSAGAGSVALANMRIEAAKTRLELSKSARDAAYGRIGSATTMEDSLAAIAAYSESNKIMMEAAAGVTEAIADFSKAQAKTNAIITGAPDTDKGIKAKIQLLEELRSETKRGSAEYDSFTRRINELEKQLPKTTTKVTGGKKGKKDIKTEVSESLTELQRLEDELKTVENSMAPYGKASEEWKSMNIYAEELRQKIRALNGEMEQLETGTSVQSGAGMSAYINTIKQDLEKADFGSSLYKSLQQQLADMTSLQGLVAESLRAGLGTALFDVADATGMDFWTRAMEGGVDDVEWQTIADKINERLKEMGLEPIKIDFQTGNIAKTGKETENSWRAAANAMQSVNGALQQMEDPGAKIMGIIGQAIANIALGFAQASASAANTASGIWGWIAGIAGGIGTMVSTIAAIHSATGYAQGGIVKGNSYSGDNIPADTFVNAGELILNRSQQNAIASQLTEVQGGGGSGVARVSGEQIWVALNAFTRRSGKGELVTWK